MSISADSELLTQRPTWKRSVITTVWLSVLFVVIYSSTNWITSLRTDVGTWYYAWERYIPFVKWMIIPYMSIDLLFLGAPFLCSTVKEQQILARRIAFAIVVAGVCFLLFPLQLAVERQPVDGWLGVIFNHFRELDLPYNLCPSLHIALRTILAVLYAEHTRGLTRVVSNVWFSLIGISTLLTYQHHVIDIIGGFILANVSFYFVRETSLRLPAERNLRVGTYYALASAALVALAIGLASWWLWLLWPATATALVASGYFFFGAGIYGKRRGRLPLASMIVLGPILAGQYLSLLYYRRQCRAWNRVTDQLWIGRALSDSEAELAIDKGVTAVVDLTVNFSEAKPFRDINYLQLPVLDLTAPTARQLDEAVKFIDAKAKHGIVYVHCKVGYSRSAVIVAACLLGSGMAADAKEAIDQLRSIRPTIVIRPEAEAAIRNYADQLCKISTRYNRN